MNLLPVTPPIFDLPKRELKIVAKGIQKESKGYPPYMIRIEKPDNEKVDEAWRSRHFLGVVFETDNPKILRITVNRTAIDIEKRRWIDGITWDDLQRIKGEMGFKEYTAIEFYPPQDKLVNVANQRHLWVFLDESLVPDFMWK